MCRANSGMVLEKRKMVCSTTNFHSSGKSCHVVVIQGCQISHIFVGYHAFQPVSQPTEGSLLK